MPLSAAAKGCQGGGGGEGAGQRPLRQQRVRPPPPPLPRAHSTAALTHPLCPPSVAAQLRGCSGCVQRRNRALPFSRQRRRLLLSPPLLPHSVHFCFPLSLPRPLPPPPLSAVQQPRRRPSAAAELCGGRRGLHRSLALQSSSKALLRRSLAYERTAKWAEAIADLQAAIGQGRRVEGGGGATAALGGGEEAADEKLKDEMMGKLKSWAMGCWASSACHSTTSRPSRTPTPAATPSPSTNNTPHRSADVYSQSMRPLCSTAARRWKASGRRPLRPHPRLVIGHSEECGSAHVNCFRKVPATTRARGVDGQLSAR